MTIAHTVIAGTSKLRVRPGRDPAERSIAPAGPA